MHLIYSKQPQKCNLKIKRKLFELVFEQIINLTKIPLSELDYIIINFVNDRIISKINQNFVNHTGTTDVITFDYRNSFIHNDNVIAEIFVNYDKAILEVYKGRQTTFSKELTLYIVHGILHLTKYNDLTPNERTKMRKAERNIMTKLSKNFNINEIFYLKT